MHLRVQIKVTGIVQGVGFRPFVYRLAVESGLRGYVRNRGDAGVEILVEGASDVIELFMRRLKNEKPPLAQIHTLSSTRLPGKEMFTGFAIFPSSDEVELEGSTVPPDIAICEECLAELRAQKDPRFDYFFITCTNCGPRFTTIERLPYDRDNTTMREFPMCGFCQSEYNDPLNRRFHAQTIACPKCGPKVYLTMNDGEVVDSPDPVRSAGRLLTEGYIVAIKGYGGFHIASSACKDQPLARLRSIKHRRNKPFAIMARNVEAAKTFARITEAEEKLLTSYARPIVLLNKSENYDLSPLVAPGLHNVGVMLPYTGTHYMLFDNVPDKAFVMTSANPPDQPIVHKDEIALKELRGTVDYFLFHNRRVAERCDDSVIRLHGRHRVFIRRSRGFAPAPILLKENAKQSVMGVGADLNNTVCVLIKNKAFISQHIGDVENIETKTFLREAAVHLMHLTNCDVKAVVCDLHPKFTTTKLAEELTEENQWPLIRVQHHHAHAAALISEHGLDEIIGVICDGYGYGEDGQAWGGEILECTRYSESFRRLAHLEPQMLLGGDVATRYPLRLAAAMLHRRFNVEEWLVTNREKLPHGKVEADLILRQLSSAKHPLTTSCGRVLDAVAAVLGLCYERTYEGEPAMKLESAAMKGGDTLKLEPVIVGNVLNTTELVSFIFDHRTCASTADLAYLAHAYIAKGLAQIAVEKAAATGIRNIGFSGGVACNFIISSIMRKTVENAGLRFYVNEAVPPGDGGISFGQAVIGGFLVS